jgi:hypothetical protein
LGFFTSNSRINRCQLLEVEDKERFFKCRTQQTLKRLQEYGVDFLEGVGVGGAWSKHL